MNEKIVKRWQLLSLVLMIILLSSTRLAVAPVWADHPESDPITPENLADFFDKFIPAGMTSYQLPGVVIAVVANGQLTYSQGYGYADLENQIPVHPGKTLFDVGSVAKLFTFTAVMQLVESGDLDLERDVNHYLTSFKIPDTYDQPVTVAHLLTHTGGFDEWDIGAAARTADEVLPVCEYLAHRMPPRVRPPGDLITYSNHGTALAGCLIEEVSGLPFAEYIERYIFLPLEMPHSTFLWPPELISKMAVGYQQANGGFEPREVYYRHFGPAGELKTTAEDISRFMLAHLQNGRFDEVEILNPKTARLMHEQQFTHHPLLPGLTYGFFEDSFNGRRALVHGGDTNPIFSSLLVLLPEEGVGIFVAHNTAEYNFREALIQAFMDRFFPVEESSVSPTGMAGHIERAEQFSGSYQPTFMIRETSLEKLLTLFAQFQITADSEGLITLHEPSQLVDAVQVRWIETEPLIFNSLDGQHRMIFIEDDGGEIRIMATSRYPGAAFLPVPWYETLIFNFVLLGMCLCLFLSGILGWFLGRKQRPLLWHTAALVGLINTVFVFGLVVMLQALSLDAIFGLPTWATLLRVLPMVSLAFSLAGLGHLILTLNHKNNTIISNLHTLLVFVAGLAFTWQMLYWHLTILD
jgi:CubicO group peptidase (beta-lactamase class C family)